MMSWIGAAGTPFCLVDLLVGSEGTFGGRALGSVFCLFFARICCCMLAIVSGMPSLSSSALLRAILSRRCCSYSLMGSSSSSLGMEAIAAGNMMVLTSGVWLFALPVMWTADSCTPFAYQE